MKRPGYLFNGWAKSQNAKTADYEDGATITLSDDNPSITLYAVWIENNHTITFDANGGTIVTQTQTVLDTIKTALAKLSVLNVTREGYIFKGWATSRTASTPQFADGEAISITEDMTLYAVWAYNVTYTVTFKANGGSLTTTTQTITGETTTGSLATALLSGNELGASRTGYKLKGWANDENVNEITYTDGKSITISENLTLYAVWDKIITYTVTYNAN
ncbi:MAG: InlB B-repeat-containing protein, partial [Treponema sp.]|nr:InlB B-repeat-containing protein [Treponema sp.]